MITRLSSILLFASVLFVFGCKTEAPTVQPDVVYSTQLTDLRLGDGVPLNLDIFLRWEIEDPKLFYQQFPATDTFNHMVIYPRAMELGSSAANDFESVDSVFSSQREQFLETIKQALLTGITEPGMKLKAVTVSRIEFPATYTTAMEKVGLQRQMLEAIRQEKAIAIEQAQANKEKAEAESKVIIAQAEADGRVAQINARTEESRRKNELARAETQAQMTRKQAQAEADRNRLLAKAELEKKTDLKDLDLKKQQQLDDLEIAKSKKVRLAEMEGQLEMANMVQANPSFASFLINRELASKVEIAVLPTGADPNVFGSILNQGMNKSNN